MSILKKLTEGIVRRDLSKEGSALLSKWEKTGLLEGLGNERAKYGMAALLENQAKELLREASTMAGSPSGDVEGFASVAFPIVRRVFGGLIANDLVSVQPMSLPSGLIFFLDFTYDRARLDTLANTSVYGGGVVASQITGGVSLAGNLAEQSYYSLNNGYSSPTGSVRLDTVWGGLAIASGTVGGGSPGALSDWTGTAGAGAALALLGDRLVRFDSDIASGTNACVISVPLATFAPGAQFNIKDYITITLEDGTVVDTTQVRRLTRDDPNTAANILLVCASVAGTPVTLSASMVANDSGTFIIDDNFAAGNAVGSVAGLDTWGLENNAGIPEIDIKVDSVAVTAKTKKLKAKWTPELAQDLNAYHNLESTSLLKSTKKSWKIS